MPLADPPRPSMEITSVQQVVDYLIGYVRWFSDFINHIDTLNVEELDAVVVNTGTLNANLVKIAAVLGGNSFTLDTTGIVANNGTVDTLKFDLTTGLLTIMSALIQSAAGYPRVEINSSTNLIGAYQTANNAVRVVPTYSTGTPAILFMNGGIVKGFIQDLLTDLYIATNAGTENIQISSGKDLYLTASNAIRLSGSPLIINGSTGVSGTVYVSSTSGGPATTPITFTNGIRTS